MSEKLNILEVSYTDKRKDGTDLISEKSGKPYFRVGIKVDADKYKDRWINGFLLFAPDNWKGTEQELEITEEEWQGQKQLKFKLPNKQAQQDEGLKQINEKLDTIIRLVSVPSAPSTPKEEYPDKVY